MELKQYDIIKRPIVSDKAYKLSKQNKILVQIHNEANASEVKKAAERLFGVKVDKINIIKRPGKARRVAKSRRIVWGQDQKRALITLAEGSKLDLFGHVANQTERDLNETPKGNE